MLWRVVIQSVRKGMLQVGLGGEHHDEEHAVSAWNHLCIQRHRPICLQAGYLGFKITNPLPPVSDTSPACGRGIPASHNLLNRLQPCQIMKVSGQHQLLQQRAYLATLPICLLGPAKGHPLPVRLAEVLGQACQPRQR